MRRRLCATSILLATTLALAVSQVTLEEAVDSRGIWTFSSTGAQEEREMSRAARTIVKKVLSVEQAEGVGARVRRSVGRPEVGVPAPSPAHPPGQ